jgi:dihydrolipoamide dehydrogenase
MFLHNTNERAMEEKKFDVAILGAGPGGYPAAIKLAQKGLTVALIEAKELGGTCLNRGCIPTKALLANAEVLYNMHHAKDFGISLGEISIDFTKMQSNKDSTVSKLRNSLKGLIQANKITIIEGFGSFIGPTKLEVKGPSNCIIEAKHIIIATGSEPKNIPAFAFDGNQIHSSTSLLHLKQVPKSLAIVGGGVIGCEFASLFSELGTKVTIIEMLDRLLPLECPTISKALTLSFEKRGIEVITKTGVQAIDKNEKGVSVSLQDGKKIEAECALVAVGRSLNSENIGLEKIGVKTEKGAILVDDEMKTSVSNIYAIGDVVGKSLYAHVATHQGLVAADNILGHKASMNYMAIPGVIFTHPEIGTCGLTLDQAKEKGYKAKRAPYPFQALGKAQAAHQTEGFAQVIIDEKTGQILGAQVIGHEAGNLIATMCLAITNELTIECISETIHAHPTLAEAWMESALIAQNMPLHFPPK